MTKAMRLLVLSAAVAISPAPLAAQGIEPPSDTTRYLMDSLLFVSGGVAALIALLGLALRDLGVVRPQSAPSICLRSAGAYAIAAIMFWLTGYGLAFSVEDGGLLGDFNVWSNEDIDPLAAGSSAGARWFFYMGLAALGAVITSGAAAERVKLWPFLVAGAVFAGLIFPIVVSWSWSEGYFASIWRFKDHGGAAVLHASAGAAALAAILVVGPRAGKYGPGANRLTPTTSLPMTFIGLVFFWIGMLVINAAGLGALNSVETMISAATIIVNTTIAGAAGLFTAVILTQIVYRRANLAAVVSGAIGGLVSVAADPLYPAIWQVLLIGGVGGVVVTVAPPFLDRFRLDDVSNAVAAHLLCGVWSTIIVAWTNPEAWLVGQLAGVTAIVVFSFFTSVLVWTALKYTFGVRLVAFDPASPKPA